MEGFRFVVGVVAGALIAYAWVAKRDEAGKRTLVIVSAAVVTVGAAGVAEVAFLAERPVGVRGAPSRDALSSQPRAWWLEMRRPRWSLGSESAAVPTSPTG